MEKIGRAAEHIRPDWTDERARAVEARLARESPPRRRIAMGFAFAAVLAAAAFGLLRRTVSPAVTPPATAQLVRLSDGSTIAPIDGSSSVEQTVARPELSVFRLGRGGARFDVAPRRARVFRVEAGDVTVEVLGTRFLVQRQGDEVQVAVERGTVRVRAGSISIELREGERANLPAHAPTVAEEPPPLAPAELPPTIVPGHSHTWGDLAREGDFNRAYEAMHRAVVRDEPADLLAAADVARFSHHPAEAVPPLRRLVRNHSHDPRAPLAAFTLGRVLLEELGEPSAAAEAFAQTRSLAPRGPLCEDALAREVEAWSRAGESARAQKLAEAYLAQYPRGRRASAVRRYGGLE